MINAQKKTISKLKLFFVSAVAISVILFMLTVAYTQKYEVSISNIILERYAIIVTLIGIPVALKLFHNNIKKINNKDLPIYLKKYTQQYILRLSILLSICFFNIAALFFTGSKNFYFMVIVSIFAMFLCIPQKSNIEDSETENSED